MSDVPSSALPFLKLPSLSITNSLSFFLHFLFISSFLFPSPRHLLPIIQGILTRARASRFTTAQGQQQIATQSANNPAVHDLQYLPEHSIRSPPSSTAYRLLLSRLALEPLWVSFLRAIRDGFPSIWILNH